MRVELGRLQNEPQTALVTDLVMAASMLGLPSYERYKLAAERAVCDLLCETHFDLVSNHEYFMVRSHRYSDAPPCIFKSKDDRCNCIERIKACDQCAHEICWGGGLILLVLLKDTTQESVPRDPSLVGRNCHQII